MYILSMPLRNEKKDNNKVIQKSMFFGDITYLILDKNCQKNLLISLALAQIEKRIATRPPTNSNINDKVSLGKY